MERASRKRFLEKENRPAGRDNDIPKNKTESRLKTVQKGTTLSAALYIRAKNDRDKEGWGCMEISVSLMKKEKNIRRRLQDLKPRKKHEYGTKRSGEKGGRNHDYGRLEVAGRFQDGGHH